MPIRHLSRAEAIVFQQYASQVYELIESERTGLDGDSSEELRAKIRLKLAEILSEQKLRASETRLMLALGNLARMLVLHHDAIEAYSTSLLNQMRLKVELDSLSAEGIGAGPKPM